MQPVPAVRLHRRLLGKPLPLECQDQVAVQGQRERTARKSAEPSGTSCKQIQQHAQIAAIEPINKHAAEERDEQAGQRDYNHLEADFDGRMRGREDVPADPDEVHAAAKQGHEHGQEKVTEPALRPNNFPVDTRSADSGACHRTTSLLS